MPIRHIFPYLEKICNLPNPTFYVTLNPFRGEESRWKDVANLLPWILRLRLRMTDGVKLMERRKKSESLFSLPTRGNADNEANSYFLIVLGKAESVCR